MQGPVSFKGGGEARGRNELGHSTHLSLFHPPGRALIVFRSFWRADDVMTQFLLFLVENQRKRGSRTCALVSVSCGAVAPAAVSVQPYPEKADE